MQFDGQKALRKGHTRRRYGKAEASVTTRLSDDGTELLFETSIPVSKGFSDVCVVVPVESRPELVRLGLSRGRSPATDGAVLQNSES